jgi:hypothetical protein
MHHLEKIDQLHEEAKKKQSEADRALVIAYQRSQIVSEIDILTRTYQAMVYSPNQELTRVTVDKLKELISRL